MAKAMKSAKTGKLLREYKLIAGGHIQADPMWVPTEEEVADAKARGTSARPPLQSFTAPAIVRSDKNLAEMFPEKFQYMTDPRQPVQAVVAKNVVGTTEENTLEDLSEETSEKTTDKSEEDKLNTSEDKSQDAKQTHTTEGKSAKHKHK